MKSHRRGIATALLVAVTTLAAACVPPTPATPAATGRRQAANWLAHQFDGSTHLIPSPFVPGTSDLGGSAYSATSLVLAGWGDSTAANAVAWQPTRSGRTSSSRNARPTSQATSVPAKERPAGHVARWRFQQVGKLLRKSSQSAQGWTKPTSSSPARAQGSSARRRLTSWSS